eukprot:UN30343
MDIVRQAGYPTDYISSSRLKQLYPNTNFPKEWGATRDPNGGILLAHKCLSVVQNMFIKAGGKIIISRVQNITDNGVVTVKSLDGNIKP